MPPQMPIKNEDKAEAIIAVNTLLIDLIRDTLASSSTFRFAAAGGSMQPFIYSGDTVSITPLPDSPKLGDVLAFIHPQDGRLLVHRLIQKKVDNFLMKGDNTRDHNDGWVSTPHLLGRVKQVERGKRKITFGLGVEKYLIALLSRWNKLVPILNGLRSAKHFFKL